MKMRVFFPLTVLFGLVVLSGCVSKKKYLLTVAELGRTVDSLQLVSTGRQSQVEALRLSLARTQGANDALLETQDRLQDRLDELQMEIDGLKRSASSTEEELVGQIADKEGEIDDLRGQLQAIADLLERRKQRVQTVADSLTAKLTFLPSNRYDVRIRAGVLVLSFNEDMLFRGGSTSRMLANGENALAVTVEVLQAFPEMAVQVIGHTDNQPVQRQSLDNWQYSALRAVSVVKYMTQEHALSPNRVLAATKGEYAPRVSNETPGGRAENRRVDINITPTDGDLEREVRRVLERPRS